MATAWMRRWSLQVRIETVRSAGNGGSYEGVMGGPGLGSRHRSPEYVQLTWSRCAPRSRLPAARTAVRTLAPPWRAGRHTSAELFELSEIHPTATATGTWAVLGAGALPAVEPGKVLIGAGNLNHSAATAQGVADLEWNGAIGLSGGDVHLLAGSIVPAACIPGCTVRLPGAHQQANGRHQLPETWPSPSPGERSLATYLQEQDDPMPGKSRVRT